MNSPALIRTMHVPGAELYTETRGSGPLLLFIVGGNGDPSVFVPVADVLATSFTVVTYARRGFSLSPLDDAVDDASRLALDVADAVALIEQHGDGPAFVFGSSSGAIVALELVATHPNEVRTVVAHEPPILALLDDPQQWREIFDGIHATYESEGLWPAMAEFVKVVGLGGLGDGSTAALAAAPREVRRDDDMKFWFEHEFRQYPAYVPDIEVLSLRASQIALAAGTQSRLSDAMPYRPAVTLATIIHRDVVEFSGGHVGYLQEPSEFAKQLRDLLNAE